MPFYRRDEQAAQDRNSAQSDQSGVRPPDENRRQKYEREIGGKLASCDRAMDGKSRKGWNCYSKDQGN